MLSRLFADPALLPLKRFGNRAKRERRPSKGGKKTNIENSREGRSRSLDRAGHSNTSSGPQIVQCDMASIAETDPENEDRPKWGVGGKRNQRKLEKIALLRELPSILRTFL